MPPEEKKIEPHYQAQAKMLADGLFDGGFFSETLSRDGMNDVEDLLAFFLQTAAESATRCAIMNKKFKEGTRKMGEVPLEEETFSRNKAKNERSMGFAGA